MSGHDVVREAASVRRAIGFAMQEAGLARYATGREHLIMMGAPRRPLARATRARSDELRTLFGLEEAADRQVRTYSGGMRRRIDLAGGLVHRPRTALPRRADRPASIRPRARRSGTSCAGSRARASRCS